MVTKYRDLEAMNSNYIILQSRWKLDIYSRLLGFRMEKHHERYVRQRARTQRVSIDTIFIDICVFRSELLETLCDVKFFNMSVMKIWTISRCFYLEPLEQAL